MNASELVVATPSGLYCAAGYFYIDPWRPVARAVRFPCILRWRTDKPFAEADRLDTLKALA
jgi:hypothetical protein